MTMVARPIGTGRLLPPAFDTDAGTGHIGRMAVLRVARGASVGGLMLRALISAAPTTVTAQSCCTRKVTCGSFYARHGFVAEGAEFLEVGIPHVLMRETNREGTGAGVNEDAGATRRTMS